MKRLLTSALAAALVVAGAAGDARAQDDMVGRRASLFDLGIYAGGAYSTDWFSAGDEGWNTGMAPIFGLTAAYWLSPSFGIRVHGAYFPSHLPEEEEFFGDDGDRWLGNNYLYDLDLVYRPFFWSAGGPMMSSLYLFLGGGGYTSNIGGQHPYPGCLPVAVWAADGVCVSDLPTISTTGQGVLGLGVDLFPISSMLGIFLEGAVHGYDSPAHVAEGLGGEDKITFTPRLVLGLKAMFGDILPPP
ncbi:MAG TPA: hypothetical protein VEW03_02995, partial [Longimicrobiaceae bacterium]|nr:hypothetical protein [Longimicrobiaceae bacterium]